ILHECTHAVMDLRMASLNTELNEALAYICQLLYLLERGHTLADAAKYRPPSDLDELTQTSVRLIVVAAARIADNIRKGNRAVPEDEVQVLYFGIRTASLYRDKIDKPVGNDGVGEAFYYREMEKDKYP